MVKCKLNEWYDWLLVDYVPKPIKNVADKAYLRAKKSILRLYDGAKKALKDEFKDQKQTEHSIDLTPHENERTCDYYDRVEMPYNSLMA